MQTCAVTRADTRVARSRLIRITFPRSRGDPARLLAVFWLFGIACLTLLVTPLCALSGPSGRRPSRKSLQPIQLTRPPRGPLPRRKTPIDACSKSRADLRLESLQVVPVKHRGVVRQERRELGDRGGAVPEVGSAGDFHVRERID